MSEEKCSILNKDVFFKDPTSYSIPNDGVTKIGPIKTDNEWKVALYELEDFVCKGSYHKGLYNILESFLTHLDQPSQPAVWVSGFFGSGKSHLARVLEFLWSDLRFPDGITAREICNVSPDIKDKLIELSTQARRSGGIWSAAGTLSAGSGRDPRLAVLQVVLRSAGLPENLDIARLHLWLAELGILDQMNEKLKQAGKERDMKLPFVSDVFAGCLLELNPGFAESKAQAKEFLIKQFKTDTQLTNDTMVEVLSDIFLLKSGNPKKMPLVLLVLDEVQQYLTIGENAEQLLTFQEVIEECCKKFGSNLLVVATGQEALQANLLLQRLQGRFSEKIELESKDVDVVLRETILRKKESMNPCLKGILEKASGEISRHLGGTKFEHSTQDDSNLLLDYPLLPTRKRLWDRVLHAIDTGGMTTQLRTQLRLVFEGTRRYASESIGTVIPSDFIFEQQNTHLLRNNILAPEINEMISRENNGTEDGILKSRICALLFLIQQIDESYGIYATEDTLADLLISDLTKGSSDLRRKIPILLQDLHDRGIISKVDNNYRIQTKEGREWDADYQSLKANYKVDDTKILFKRDELLKKVIEGKRENLVIAQGLSRTNREIETILFNSQRPEIGSKIPFWFRNGWEITENVVKSEAIIEGNESPLVMVFIPKMYHEEFKNEIAGLIAANEVITNRAIPTTSEGHQAKSNIEAKLNSHSQKVNNLLSKILEESKVFLGGGNEINNSEFVSSIKEAAEKASERMYFFFNDGDASGWDRVITKVKADDKAPLSVIGFNKATEEHPVCKEILRFLNSGPKTGNEIYKKFHSEPPFGWPKESIEAVLFALISSEHIRGMLNNKSISVTNNRRDLKSSTFNIETVVISIDEKLSIRSLYQLLDLSTEVGKETEMATTFLNELISLSKDSGGDPPLPLRDSPSYLQDLRASSGNPLIKEILAKQQDIRDDIKKWKDIKELIDKRIPKWEVLKCLISCSSGLNSLPAFQKELEAIVNNRSLLNDPDPVQPLILKLQGELRNALNTEFEKAEMAKNSALEILQKNTQWDKVDESKQKELIKKYKLERLSIPSFNKTEEIIRQLKQNSLSSFHDRTQLIELSIPKISEEIEKMLVPETSVISLNLPLKINSEHELNSFIENLRSRINKELSDGKPVMLK